MTEEIHAFVDVQDTREVSAPFFKEGEVVTIKKFSYADRQTLSGEYLKLSADWGSAEDEKDEKDEKASKAKRKAVVKSEIILGRMNLSILDKGIKSWTLYTREGKEVTLSRKNVRRLTEPYAEFILAEINEFNPTRSSGEDEDEEDSFFLEAGSGSEGDG